MPVAGGVPVGLIRVTGAGQSASKSLPSDTPHASGVRRIGSKLRQLPLIPDRGIDVRRHHVRILLRINGIRPIWKRKFIHTTDSRHAFPIADNVLDRQFEPVAANMA